MNTNDRLSFADFECWCMLSSIPDEGCDPIRLTERLGLALPLADAVLSACLPLVEAGALTLDESGVIRLTTAGRRSRDGMAAGGLPPTETERRSLPAALN